MKKNQKIEKLLDKILISIFFWRALTCTNFNA